MRNLTEQVTARLASFQSSLAFAAPEMVPTHVYNLDHDIRDMLAQYDRGVYDDECERPLLGLATTRELLTELRSRGEVDNIPSLMDTAHTLLDKLSEPILNQRPVDDI